GEIGEKRTRRGKPFWGCTRYPECDWSIWDRPTPGPCPECKAPLLVEKSSKKRGDYIKCPACNNEFTRAESGELEHAASPRAAGPPVSGKRPFKKSRATARKVAPPKKVPVNANDTATAPAEVPASGNGKATAKKRAAKAKARVSARKVGASKPATKVSATKAGAKKKRASSGARSKGRKKAR
ncbi:MAG: topoisomerase DNA-binding C4 zinc finger domain-containing protein, partial [Longimicrobiales bacterium]